MLNKSSSPTMTNVVANASGGRDTNIGVSNEFSSPVMTNITATASGWGAANYGVYNYRSSPTIQNSTISGNDGTDNYGIFNDATSGVYTVTVNNSQITGGTNTIRNDAEFTTLIGASKLEGGGVGGSGAITCAGVYNEAYVFYASTCP